MPKRRENFADTKADPKPMKFQVAMLYFARLFGGMNRHTHLKRQCTQQFHASELETGTEPTQRWNE